MAKFPAPLTYFKQSVVFRCPATYENCAAGGDSGARRGQFLCDIDTRDPYTVLVYGIDVEAIQPLLSFLQSVRTVPWVPEIGTFGCQRQGIKSRVPPLSDPVSSGRGWSVSCQSL